MIEFIPAIVVKTRAGVIGRIGQCNDGAYRFEELETYDWEITPEEFDAIHAKLQELNHGRQF